MKIKSILYYSFLIAFTVFAIFMANEFMEKMDKIDDQLKSIQCTIKKDDTI